MTGAASPPRSPRSCRTATPTRTAGRCRRRAVCHPRRPGDAGKHRRAARERAGGRGSFAQLEMGSAMKYRRVRPEPPAATRRRPAALVQGGPRQAGGRGSRRVAFPRDRLRPRGRDLERFWRRRLRRGDPEVEIRSTWGGGGGAALSGRGGRGGVRPAGEGWRWPPRRARWRD